jgi:CHAT domain-containing protein
LARGEIQKAIVAYQETVEWTEAVLGSIQSQPIAYASLQAPLYAEFVSVLATKGEIASAFAISERARAYDLRRRLSGVQAMEISASDKLALEAVEQRIKTSRKFLSPGSFLLRFEDSTAKFQRSAESRLKEAENEREEILAKIERLHPQAATLLGRQTVTLADLQQKLLDANSSLVAYFVTETETFAWVVSREDVHMVRLPTGRAELAGKIEYLRAEISRRAFDRPTADGLYERLLAPLEPFLRHRHLVVVPHGPLHTLPFAALWSERQGQYALEKRTLTVVPSGTALRFLGERRTPFSGRALVFGNPDGSLPSSAAEAQAVAELFRTDPLLGDKAQLGRLRKEAGRADIVHLATHGLFVSNDPLSSYVQLAPSGMKGRLQVRDVLALDLAQTDLVVLSACSTGRGQVSESDDVVGLTRAFLAAGAPSVITTLWPVDDEASAALMTSFYRHLLQPGTRAAEALRAAQLEVRGRPEWSSPYFWAGFILNGVDGVLVAPISPGAPLQVPSTPPVARRSRQGGA